MNPKEGILDPLEGPDIYHIVTWTLWDPLTSPLHAGVKGRPVGSRLPLDCSDVEDSS